MPYLLSAADIKVFCKDIMDGYKIPAMIIFIDELTRTPTGKIIKRELGAKTGKGFYEWTPEFTEAWRKKILKGLVAFARSDKRDEV